MKVFGVVIIVILLLIVLLVILLIAAYNSLIKLRNNAEEGFSTMDVYLKQRYDLIPNLVETVKGYAAHEQETLEGVMAARASISASATAEERMRNESMLTGSLGRLFAVSEGYPDLKASANFENLQNQLGRVEEDIANSRKYYNAVVKMFNTKCQVFPTNLIAGMFRFETKPLFQVEEQVERQNVKVQF